jgi:hypothetical protein
MAEATQWPSPRENQYGDEERRQSAQLAEEYRASKDAESSAVSDPTEMPKDYVERSGSAFKIVYMDGSSEILESVMGYTIRRGWIEFRDAVAQLQSVRAKDVRRISRLRVEDPTKSETVGARRVPESRSGTEKAGDAESLASASAEENATDTTSRMTEWWISAGGPDEKFSGRVSGRINSPTATSAQPGDLVVALENESEQPFTEAVVEVKLKEDQGSASVRRFKISAVPPGRSWFAFDSKGKQPATILLSIWFLDNGLRAWRRSPKGELEEITKERCLLQGRGAVDVWLHRGDPVAELGLDDAWA